MGCIGTSGVGKGWSEEGVRERAMPCNFCAKAIRCCACMAKDSLTDEPGYKGMVAEGGTRAKEPKGTNPTVEIAIADQIPKTGRPKEGTRDGTSRA